MRSHGYSLLSSLGRFLRAPLSHLLTLGVIAVALALPTLSLVLLGDLQRLGAGLAQTGDVNLFLQAGMDEPAARALARRLREQPEIAAVVLKSPAEALAEFREFAEFSDALSALEDNPLPWVLAGELKSSAYADTTTRDLVQRLRGWPEVELVQFDQEWLARLKALIGLVQRGVLVVGALLGMAVLLVIGNTIRLEILTRRDEIIIMKLVGADDAFIRRPFIYSGLWFGLLGAIGALALVGAGLLALGPAVKALAVAYGSSFALAGLTLGVVAEVLVLGILLGAFGAWLASRRHLAEAEPT
jgi:cell division transport system permease protein